MFETYEPIFLVVICRKVRKGNFALPQRPRLESLTRICFYLLL